jgi:hypothetical protein
MNFVVTRAEDLLMPPFMYMVHYIIDDVEHKLGNRTTTETCRNKLVSGKIQLISERLAGW